jgi:hypothetical protein
VYPPTGYQLRPPRLAITTRWYAPPADDHDNSIRTLCHTVGYAAAEVGPQGIAAQQMKTMIENISLAASQLWGHTWIIIADL